MKTVPLGEVVEFYSGGTPAKSNASFWNGCVPWFSAKDLKQARLADSIDHVSDSVFEKTSLRKLPAGTVAIVVRGMILAHTVPIAILDVDSAINQDLKALLPRREIDPRYLATVLRAQQVSILGQVSTAAHGTKKLDSRVLEEVRIPLPSLPEQRRIAAIIDRADALRASYRSYLTRLELLAQAVFNAAVDSDTSVATIGSVISWRSGLFLPASKQFPGPYPVYGGNGVNGYHRAYMFESEKVVVGRVGAYCGAVHLAPACSWITDNALYVSELHTELASEFLAAALVEARLNRFASQSGQPLISAGRIADVRIPVPPMWRQREYGGRIERVNFQRSVVRRALATVDELISSLQHRAFRGEL